MILALLLQSAITLGAYQQAQPVLNCGKYQHEQRLPARCANTCDSMSGICTTGCLLLPAEATCVDDTHTVSEKEWQELMQRLHALEQDKHVR